MIRFGLRLTVTGGREAIVRLVIIAAAVALGVGLLLAVLAGINAVQSQNSRYAWLNTGSSTPARTVTGAPAPDPVWWLTREDYFDGRTIGRVDVAATGPYSPIPPGLRGLPGPGQYYASPALRALVTSTPNTQLGDRFQGHVIGTIGPAALPDPKALVVVVGHTPDELSRLPHAERAIAIETRTPPVVTASVELILSVTAIGLLFPVLIFVGTATRLSAARREQRFAALRLLGATPRQVSVIAAVESTAAAAAGTATGFGLFFLFRHSIAAIPFTGAPFYPNDLAVGPIDVLLVALGVPAGAAAAALLALRRVRISPLGVTRRATPRPPRAYRLVPLLLGIGELAYFVGRRPETASGQTAAFVPGFLVTMAGLVIAGPWLTMTGARLVARRATRPAALIAARRLADDPQAAFRAVSGLVLALFVTTVAVATITTVTANRDGHGNGDDTLAATMLSAQFWSENGTPTATSVPEVVSAGLTSIAGGRGVIVIRRNPDESPDSLEGLISCAELARAAGLGRCPSSANGTGTAEVWPDVVGPAPAHGGTWRGPRTTWRPATVLAANLRQLPVLAIVVRTDGSATALERARTILETAYPLFSVPPATDDDFTRDSTRSLAGWKRLSDTIILVSLPIAGCSLAVGIAGGLSERKRPFSLLRLTGVPLRMLRHVVALESAVPLLVAATVATGAGLIATQLFLSAQLGYTLRPPEVGYYAIVIGGLAVSLAIIASTLPLLDRITGPETARNN